MGDYQVVGSHISCLRHWKEGNMPELFNCVYISEFMNSDVLNTNGEHRNVILCCCVYKKLSLILYLIVDYNN